MQDAVARTLIAFVGTQILFMALLPLILIPPPDGLELRLYAIGFASARDLVIEAAAWTVLLFTLAVIVQRRWWLTGFLASTPLIGVSLVLAPFWFNTGGLAPAEMQTKGWLFFAGYVALALVLGAVFWFFAVMERRGGHQR